MSRILTSRDNVFETGSERIRVMNIGISYDRRRDENKACRDGTIVLGKAKTDMTRGGSRNGGMGMG